MYKVKRKRRR